MSNYIPTPTTMRGMNVATRARFVARIFDILAWIVLIVGALAVAVVFLAGLSGNMSTGFDSNWSESFLTGTIYAVGIAIYTALGWASITLGTVVAGYIGARSE